MAEAVSTFFRLHPHVQHAIVHELGWRELRPVQEMAIEAILAGCNTVVLAPTAGGKTEAALFPLLSGILAAQTEPVAALYVCPIRALLNNQEERIGAYARMVGLGAFKWHGDVAESTKRRFRAEPAHILMTTPESLEVMLISEKTDARRLFSNLAAVVIDEIHAFAADDRGAHLVSILERLSHFCGRDLQRIGLSATVGNPKEIGRWVQGSSKRPFQLVDPPRLRADRDQRVLFRPAESEVAPEIAHLAAGRKSLVFTGSRAGAERIATALGTGGVDVFVHHSSISRADRAEAEERFARGKNVAIVATSTLELGIDVGDLDQVIQIEAPSTVASYLQRLGRTGRRPGTRANCTFVCSSTEALLQAIAILRLAERGWVEDVRPGRRALHVLAHQILALSLQEGGVSRHHIRSWLSSAFPLQDVTDGDVLVLVDTMLARDILFESGGMLSLGTEGERLYGRRNFFELYAVFSAPPILQVYYGRQLVGNVQAAFVQGHRLDEGPLAFRLAGRAWEAVEVDWGSGVLRVASARAGRIPSWFGQPSMVSFELCQEMRCALADPGAEASWLDEAASSELANQREEYAPLLRGDRAPLQDEGDRVAWHTFAGGGINRLLAAGLNQLTGERWTAGNWTVRGPVSGMAEARLAVRGLGELDWDSLAHTVARGLARGRISKFQPCLPDDAESALLAERLVDVAGARAFLGEGVASAP